MKTFRLWLVLTLFAHSVFDFTGYWVLRSTPLHALFALQDGPTWPLWVAWLVSAAIAIWFMMTANVHSRLPSENSGLTIATVGIAIGIVAGIWLRSQIPNDMPGISGWVLVLIVAAASSKLLPFFVLAQLLLAFGALRILFGLDPMSALGPYGVKVSGARPAEKVAEEPTETLTKASESDPRTSAESAATSSKPVLQVREPGEEIASLRKQLTFDPSDPRLHNRLHQLLAADAGRQQEMLEHARDYLGVLVKQFRGQQAYELLSACLNRDAGFKPHADHIAALARTAFTQNDSQTALRIMHKFDSLNPGHVQTPDVFYLCARALRDSKKFAQSLKLLDYLIERYPNAAVIRDAKTLQLALRTHGSSNQA